MAGCKISMQKSVEFLYSSFSLAIYFTHKWLHFHFSLSCIGEGNGNPFQCSCLENPRGGGAWWAAVSGVSQSRTRLKCRGRSSSSSSVYMSVLPSQFVPPSSCLFLPCCVCKSILYVYVLPCPGNRFISTIFLDSMYMMFDYVWLI